MLFRRRQGRAPGAPRETLAMPAWSAGSLNSASRGRRLTGKPITESNLILRAPTQRAAVMHASMIISAPDLVAYRRNILCAGEWVGRQAGVADLLPRVRRTRARGRSNLTCLSLYLKEGATRALPRLACWAYLSLLPMGRSVGVRKVFSFTCV
jgi:hypothetical protein